MSTDTSYLAIRLNGPFQSWGFESQYSIRNTSLMPTRSAIAGVICAALGLPRGSNQEQEFLSSFGLVRMTAIAIPRKTTGRGQKPSLAVRRLQDYHTVQNTLTAERKIKDCHITHRQYLTDASFGVLLEGGTSILEKIAGALSNPVWGVWLGRKSCIPSAPILAGLRNTREEALSLLLGDLPLDAFTRREEAEVFSDGKDSLPDIPVSFETTNRVFAPRRVRTTEGGR